MNNSERTRDSRSVRKGVIGILRRGTEYLVVRRAEGIARGGCWCFPGGHVEAGETARRAVVREMREELGVVVSPRARLGSLRVEASRHVLAAWTVEHVEGEIAPAAEEVAECRWVRLSEIAELSPGLPSNRTVVEMLRRATEQGRAW